MDTALEKENLNNISVSKDAIIETVAMVGAITAQQDLTLTGELDVVTLDVSGNGDIDGNKAKTSEKTFYGKEKDNNLHFLASYKTALRHFCSAF